MPPNSKIIISDTSCLILLSKIGEFDLLKDLSASVYITPIIVKEFGEKLPDWITIRSPKDSHYQAII